MANVTTRSGKGAELTWAELDANFTSLDGALSGLSAGSSLSNAVLAYKDGLRSRPPVVLGIGDSNFSGQGAGDGTGTITYMTNAFANAPLQKLKTHAPYIAGLEVLNTAIFGDGGANIVSAPYPEYDPRLSFGSGWAATVSTGDSIGGKWFESSATTGALQINMGQRVDVIEIYTYEATSGATSVQVLNSADAVIGTFSCNAGSAAVKCVTINGSTLSDGIIKIKNNATGTAWVFGVIAYPTDRPVMVVCQGSRLGVKAADYASTTQLWSGVGHASVIKPDLSIVALTLNDIALPTTAASWNTSMVSILDKLAQWGDVAVGTGFVGGRANFTNTVWKGIELQARKTCAAYGGLFVNMHSRFYSHASAQAKGWVYDQDHMNALGYNEQAKIYAAVVKRLAGY